jgi:plasmid stability protein
MLLDYAVMDTVPDETSQPLSSRRYNGPADHLVCAGGKLVPVLHLEDVPSDLYERLRERAAAHNRPLAQEAIQVLEQGLRAGGRVPTQGELLAELRRRRFTPPPGTPDSVELLREDRER